jgi:hypothetical protein
MSRTISHVWLLSRFGTRANFVGAGLVEVRIGAHIGQCFFAEGGTCLVVSPMHSSHNELADQRPAGPPDCPGMKGSVSICPSVPHIGVAKLLISGPLRALQSASIPLPRNRRNTV